MVDRPGLELPHRMSRGAAVAFLALAAAGCREPEQVTPEPAKKVTPSTSETAAPSPNPPSPTGPVASLPPVAAYGAPAPMPSLTASVSASTSATTPASGSVTAPRPVPTPSTPSMKPAYGGPPKVKVPVPLYGGPSD
ncbi:MAG: hypothetical protein JST00_41060 [Deltaproteobacteria bacterium]|nr:hypothetical protein [Deltaproteobacteria bacterium]